VLRLTSIIKRFSGKHDLSKREYDVLRLLSVGVVSSKDIGQNLEISPRTVEKHINAILYKVQVDSKTEVICKILKHRIFYENQTK